MAVLLSLTGCTLTGCDPNPPSSNPAGTSSPGTSADDGETKSMNLDQIVQMLRSRPDIVQIMAAYSRLQATIVKDLNAAGLTREWTTIQPADSAGCDLGDSAPLVNAESRTTPNVGSKGSIPDADWPAARKIVERDAAVEGFNDTQVLQDRPGYHDIVIHGRYDSQLQFGTRLNSAMGITSGCHRIPGKPIDPNHPDST